MTRRVWKTNQVGRAQEESQNRTGDFARVPSRMNGFILRLDKLKRDDTEPGRLQKRKEGDTGPIVWFTVGDYIATILFGPFVQEIDDLNEQLSCTIR